MKPPSRLALAFLGVALWATTSGAQDQQSVETRAAEHEGEAVDLLFLGPARPLVLRLHPQIDEQPLRNVQAEYLDKQFSALDANGDGFLNRKEFEGGLPLLRRLTPGNAEATPGWDGADQPPSDGRLSRNEFTRWMASLLGTPLTVQEQPRSPSQMVGLFGMLDEDQDGRLSRIEIGLASSTLAQLDLDHDEAFSIPELRSLQNPNPSGVSSGGLRLASARKDEPLPFRVVPEDEEALVELIDLLVRRYGEGWPELERRLAAGPRPARRPGPPAQRFSTGPLANAIRNWLRDPPADLELAVELYQRRRGRPRLRRLGDERSGGLHVEQKDARGLALQLSGIDMQLRVRNPLTAASDAVQLYKLRFRTADADKNGYLDPQEFAGLNLPGADFVQVDRDGDDKLFGNELTEYVEMEADMARTRMTLTVAQEGQSLFEILDADVDRRLSPRELKQAVSRLAEFDRDGDGALAEAELHGRYRLVFTLGQSSLLQSNPAMAPQTGEGNVQPRIPNATTGPLWFRRMDRNRDGDVSRREFLGPVELFERLDADGDGLLDAQEAETADEENSHRDS